MPWIFFPERLLSYSGGPGFLPCRFPRTRTGPGSGDKLYESSLQPSATFLLISLTPVGIG